MSISFLQFLLKGQIGCFGMQSGATLKAKPASPPECWQVLADEQVLACLESTKHPLQSARCRVDSRQTSGDLQVNAFAFAYKNAAMI